MAKTPKSTDSKVLAIFRKLAGDRADRLIGSRPATEAMDRIRAGLADDFKDKVAAEIAFHLADWNSDAAFLVAVHLFPERFTDAEISQRVLALLLHAPNHLAAAAKLAGHPIQDIFGVGPLEEPRG